jgi:hypothetical protein
VNNILSTLVYLFIGYLVGIWLAAPGIFSWTVSATAWGNLLVYAYMLFWPLILLFHFIIWFIAIFAVGLVIYLILEKLYG